MKSNGVQKKNTTILCLSIQGPPDLIELTKKCLLIQGDLNVETALSANEAFEKLEIVKPDVIICDLSSAIEDSLNFLRRLREKNYGTPFISFAYEDEKELAFQSLSIGANCFVLKSCNASLVYEELKKAIVSVTKVQAL